MFKTFLPIMMIIAAGGLWGVMGVGVALVFAVALFAAWAVWRWVYVRVPELETAVIYRTNNETFDRFLPTGRHWIIPFVEHVGGTISTAPGSVKGQCANAETGGGIPLTIDWSLSYKLNPFHISAEARPKLARSLPRKAATIARSHVNNCLRHVLSGYTVEALSQPGMLTRLEREARQQVTARLSSMGFEISRVMLGAIEMPPQVRATLAEAYEQQVRASHEAQSLARLQQVVSQFSDDDMARLLELERIYKMGENGVTLLYQTAAYPPRYPPTPQAAAGRNGRRQARAARFHPLPPDAAVAGLS